MSATLTPRILILPCWTDVEPDEAESELAWLRETVYGGTWTYLLRNALDLYRSEPVKGSAHRRGLSGCADVYAHPKALRMREPGRHVVRAAGNGSRRPLRQREGVIPGRSPGRGMQAQGQIVGRTS